MDRECALSGSMAPLETAHIIPEEYANWYTHHSIFFHLSPPFVIPMGFSGTDVVHDVRNMLTHSSDVHKLWDAHLMLYIPANGEFMAYCLSPENWAVDLHCTTLALPRRTDGYLLFIRFALGVFHYLNPGKDIPTHPLALQTDIEVGTGVATMERGNSSASPTFPSTPEDSASFISSEDSEDAASLIIKACEDANVELPSDLAALWAHKLEPRKDLIRDWLAKNPQIRMLADPAQVATSSYADPNAPDADPIEAAGSP